MSTYQYLSLATVFSRGPPYRQPLYTNYLYLVSLLILSLFSALLAIYPLPALANFFELEIGEDGPFTYWQFRLWLMVRQFECSRIIPIIKFRRLRDNLQMSQHMFSKMYKYFL